MKEKNYTPEEGMTAGKGGGQNHKEKMRYRILALKEVKVKGTKGKGKESEHNFAKGSKKKLDKVIST